MVLTPTYHVFEMYVPFQGATSLPVDVTAPPYKSGELSLPSVDVSAARGSDGRIQVALVNLDPNRPASISVRIPGVSARAATGRVLTASALDAHNTFERPNAIEPAPFKGDRKDDSLVLRVPPKSVVVVAVDQ
jgi:alpha-L-arabinofuranosidase